MVEIAEKLDDYKKFYKQLGNCPKLGAHQDSTNHVKFAELEEFIDRMKAGQHVTETTGESIVAVLSVQ